jgi:hypothetical protein
MTLVEPRSRIRKVKPLAMNALALAFESHPSLRPSPPACHSQTASSPSPLNSVPREENREEKIYFLKGGRKSTLSMTTFKPPEEDDFHPAPAN